MPGRRNRALWRRFVRRLRPRDQIEAVVSAVRRDRVHQLRYLGIDLVARYNVLAQLAGRSSGAVPIGNRGENAGADLDLVPTAHRRWAAQGWTGGSGVLRIDFRVRLTGRGRAVADDRGPIAVGRGKRLWRGVGRDRTAGGRNRLLRNVILGDAGWQRTVIDARRGAIDDHDVRRSAIVAGNGHRA